MSRGNRREEIFRDDLDRKDFLETPIMHRVVSKVRPDPFFVRGRPLTAALWLMDMESLAKMSRRNYKSSFSQADHCLEKRLCIASPLVLA
jgi:hypothetical protein